MVRAEQKFGDRRIAALERGALHQPLLSAECQPVVRKGGIAIVALREIERDEEITYDYGSDYLKWFLADGGCRCAACREKKAALVKRGRG
jgi:hypothetical protein